MNSRAFLPMKKLIGVLLFLVIAVLIAASVLPADYKISRSTFIAAEPAAVHAIAQDLRTWDDWSAWNRVRDPKAVFQYSGEPGVGQTWTWTSEGELKNGSLTITSSSVPDGLRYTLQGEDGMSMDGALTYAPDARGTLVTFTSEGRLDGFFKLIGPFLDRMVGPDFEKSLAGLKARSEKAAGAPSTDPAQDPGGVATPPSDPAVDPGGAAVPPSDGDSAGK